MTHLEAQALVCSVLADGVAAHRAATLAARLADDATGQGALWQLVRAANLVPQVAVLLEAQHLTARLSPAQAEFLADAARTNAARQALLQRRAIETTRILAAEGITAAWIKGAWMTACIIDRPAMRVMEDIDLVVPATHFEHATRVVEREGFVLAAPAGLVDERIPARSFTRVDEVPGGDGRLHLDLHRGLAVSPGRAWDADAFWASTRPWRVRGGEIVGPTHAAGLVLVALHAFKHGYDVRHRWMAAADAAAIVRAAGPSLDMAWLLRALDDGLTAAAVHALFEIALHDVPSHSASLSLVRDAAARRVDVLGLRSAIDGIVRHAARLAPMAHTDFSLMAVGEAASPWQAVRQLLVAMARRRRREQLDQGSQPRAVARVLRLARTNWRYAYTSFRVGRLVSRVEATSPAALKAAERVGAGKG